MIKLPVPKEDDEQASVISYLLFRKNNLGDRLRWHHSGCGGIIRRAVRIGPRRSGVAVGFIARPGFGSQLKGRLRASLI